MTSKGDYREQRFRRLGLVGFGGRQRWPKGDSTAHLDSRSGDAVLDLLADLRRDFPMTILIARHEQHVAARSDRLLRLRDGALADDIDLRQGQPPEETLARAARLHP